MWVKTTVVCHRVVGGRMPGNDVCQAERPVRERTVFMSENRPKSRWTGVRAIIVAMKCRNWHGAKALQEGECIRSIQMETKLTAVAEKPKQAGDIRSR